MPTQCRRLFCVAVVLVAASAWAQTADELVARMINARGGLEKIKAIQTRRETGKIAFGPDAEGTFTAELARPNKLKIEVSLPNGRMVQAYDGKSGWQISSSSEQAFVMDATQQRSMAEQADFDGPLIDARQKGNRLESAGIGDLDGRKTYRLRVTLADGGVHFWELDADTYLPVRWRGNRTANGQEVGVESVFSDFREVNGVKFPFSIESYVDGKLVQAMSIESRQANIPIPDTTFATPAFQPK